MSLFNKRHYEAIAKILSQVLPKDYSAEEAKIWVEFKKELSSAFKADNPQFDLGHFHGACCTKITWETNKRT
jgi:hypothetical protein